VYGYLTFPFYKTVINYRLSLISPGLDETDISDIKAPEEKQIS